MKIYIAALYAKRFELLEFAQQLKELGHEITAQWLYNGEEKKETYREAALMDVEDVDRADTLIFIGQPCGSENRGGGRWFEFGMAYALGKRLIAILDHSGSGPHHPHESVFTELPGVSQFESTQSFIDYLNEVVDG